MYRNGVNGNHPVEDKVCEKQDTYRSEFGMPLSEWLEEQTKDLPYDPSKGYGYARYDRDLVEFGALMEPKVSIRKTLILQHLSDLYYRRLADIQQKREKITRVGGTQETFCKIARIGLRHVNTLMKELLNDKLICPFPDCSCVFKILEIDEPYVRGKEGNSYFLPYRDFLAHIRKEHFEKMKNSDFNLFVTAHIASLSTEGEKSNIEKARKSKKDPWENMLTFKKIV